MEQHIGNIYFNVITENRYNMCYEPYFAKSVHTAPLHKFAITL